MNLRILLTNLAVLLTANSAFAVELATQLRTTVGTNLDPKNAQTSLTLEPTITTEFSESQSGLFYVAVDRPFKSTDNFTLPLMALRYSQDYRVTPYVDTSASITLSALSMDRWAADGLMNRLTASTDISRKITDDLTAELVLGAFGQLNEYRQTTSGRDLPTFGFSQRLSLIYTLGPVSLDAHFGFTQSRSSEWKNGYRFYQQAAYSFSEVLVAGISHEFLGSVVDTTTGFYSPITFFNDRNSRVAAFVTYRF